MFRGTLKASIAGALHEAHEYALDYASAVGMTLGNVISVSDALAQMVGRPVRGQKPKLKRAHRCFVPRFAFISLTVTYSAS